MGDLGAESVWFDCMYPERPGCQKVVDEFLRLDRIKTFQEVIYELLVEASPNPCTNG